MNSKLHLFQRTFAVPLISVALILGGGSIAEASSTEAPTDSISAEEAAAAISDDGQTVFPSDIANQSPSAKTSGDGSSEGSGDLSDLGSEGIDWVSGDPSEEIAGASDDFDSGFESRSIVGSDTRTQVTGTPSGRNAKVAWVLGAGASGAVVKGCTGALVSSNYLLTAGHCVHDTAYGGWASELTIWVSYNGSGAGVRCYNVRMWAGSSWVSSQAVNADWGLVQLSCNAGSTFGYFGLAVNDSPSTYYNGKTIRVIGYPGDKPEGTMWSSTGAVSGNTGTVLGHQADTTGGMSGGPMLITDTAIAGIHTQGFPNIYWFTQNLGVRINQALKTTLFGLIF